MLSEPKFRETIEEMLRLAATTLPKDVIEALKKAKRRESERVAIVQLECILKNVELAQREGVPICQDTGIPIFFVELGREVNLGFDLRSSITRAVRDATSSIPLRPNLVDPITRTNTGDNTGEGQPILHLDLVQGDGLKIDLLLMGAGCENWSRFHMLTPTSSTADLERDVLRTIEEAGGQPCPPTVVGVGIGGSADLAPLLAKRALLRQIGRRNDDRELAKLERHLTEAANELEIGPMGLGGKTTVLDIHVERAGCHTASLPLAVNLNCWAARRSSARMIDDKLQVEVP
ncbi:MAG: fumarate hydratase [Candidatus Hadarchaeota archaeon]|nr:fumarate hydratase [Candidatus Hadarchaeota archaeon]